MAEAHQRITELEARVKELEARMKALEKTDEAVIRLLQDVLDQYTTAVGENVIQAECVAALKQRGFEVITYPIGHGIPHPEAGGEARPDIFVLDSVPPVLVELKRDGDWRKVAEAMLQLPVYVPLVRRRHHHLTTMITLVAGFGSKLQYPALCIPLDTSGIRYIVASKVECPTGPALSEG